jgi:UDP-N-acetyl-2-amino-2-deoxyglucuronate dehydrogenase
MQSDTERQREPVFAIIGLGFIFDRHLGAIEHVGGRLACALDVDPAKKEKLDSGVEFFTSFEDMERSEVFKSVDYVVICTPNFTHKEYAIRALRAGKNVLCEKPLVLKENDIVDLMGVENETGKRIFTVLQLRFSKPLQKIRYDLRHYPTPRLSAIDLHMHRGDFYWDGWKGKQEESGGLLFNIGIHYFDLITWLFGEPTDVSVDSLDDKKGSGYIYFGDSVCHWVLDLTADKDNQARNLTISGEKLNLTRMLESLHNSVYEAFVKGEGVALDEVIPVTRLITRLNAVKEGAYVGS